MLPNIIIISLSNYRGKLLTTIYKILYLSLTCLCCTHGHRHIMSYDLTPSHSNKCPYWIRDWYIREHDNTNETGAR